MAGIITMGRLRWIVGVGTLKAMRSEKSNLEYLLLKVICIRSHTVRFVYDRPQSNLIAIDYDSI